MTRSLSVLASVLVSVLAMAQGPSATKEQLHTLRAAYNSSKAAVKKHPSAKTRHAFVVCTDRLALATMTSEALSARTRYPEALGLYQEALMFEPHNHEAANNAGMIDGVYRGMMAKNRADLKKDPHDKAAADNLSRLEGVYRKIHRPIPR